MATAPPDPVKREIIVLVPDAVLFGLTTVGLVPFGLVPFGLLPFGLLYHLFYRTVWSTVPFGL